MNIYMYVIIYTHVYVTMENKGLINLSVVFG